MDIKKTRLAPVSSKSGAGSDQIAQLSGEPVPASKAGSKDAYTKENKHVSQEPAKQELVLPKQGPIAEIIEETKKALQRLKSGEVKPRPPVSEGEMQAFWDGISHG
ncbi:MAG: hypothetical protein EOO38_03940 [Cytophagaceae bacterium]|nr:MAG: hypothetical protein EOO38_03940 [Cytophagaceae bacterium]